MEQNYNQTQKTEQHQSNLTQLQTRTRKIKKDNRIKIDISKTEYPLLKNVATNQLGWKIWTRQQSKEEVNLFWTDTYVAEQHIKRMRIYQRVNHFPASQNLGKKNLLTNNLNRMKKLMQKQYDYYPLTFNFPNQAEEFEKLKFQQNKFFIVKPGCDSQGRGIYLTKCKDLNMKEQMVVQEYIQNPLLIEGNKFDLRIYVLLKSLNPLKIYVYHEGLSRLATCTYEKPSSQNQKNMRMHLTNYAINKLSPNFVFNKSEEEDYIGHKRSYTATMKTIEKLGCDIEHLQKQIDKIIVKTIMATYQNLSNKYKQLRNIKQEPQSICFQILGFDILIQQNFQPILLQVNHSPSFATDSPLDLTIKRCLLLDTLNLLNLNHEEKVNCLKNKTDHEPLHLFPQTSKNNRSINLQPEQIGAFRKIFPLQHKSENEELNKLYQAVFKNCKLQKLHRMTNFLPVRVKPSIRNQSLKIQNTENHQGSSTLYNVINQLKAKRAKNVTSENISNIQAVQTDDSPPPSSSITNIAEPDIDVQKIRNQQLISYERRISKDKEKQRKKYVLPMPLSNINIRLDQFQPKRDVKSNGYHYYFTPEQSYIKIHSCFSNRGFQTERTSTKKKGNHTADGKNHLPYFQSFRRTHLAGFSHISEQKTYSAELKQKLQRMQFVRLRIQKSKKFDKVLATSRNKVTVKKQEISLLNNLEQMI